MIPSLYGLIVIAVGLVLVHLALHGASGLSIVPPNKAPSQLVMKGPAIG